MSEAEARAAEYAYSVSKAGRKAAKAAAKKEEKERKDAEKAAKAGGVAEAPTAADEEKQEVVLDDEVLQEANQKLDDALQKMVGFGEGAVGALGCCSAYLGLRLKWNAHEDMLLQGIAAQEAGMIEDESSPRSSMSNGSGGRRKSQ